MYGMCINASAIVRYFFCMNVDSISYYFETDVKKKKEKKRAKTYLFRNKNKI